MEKFDKLEGFLRQRGWKFLGFWKCWRIFIKPNNPDDSPLLVRVKPDGTIEPAEWNRIVELLG